MSEINLYNGDCLEVMDEMIHNDVKVDLTVTSPPYDNLRSYNGNNELWNEKVWRSVIEKLYQITADGGIVVWIVGDATVKGSETGTSFKQALYFKEVGFNIHDTMIYQKNGLTMNHNRYEQEFEFMFILSKGKPKTFEAIRIPCKYPENENARKNSFFNITEEHTRKARSGKKRKPVGKDKIKGNIWYIKTGKNHSTKDKIAFKHPAIFPEKLAQDHIISWSNENDIVFDPFMGSGTTGKMAKINNRNFIGIELDAEYFKIAEERINKEEI